ncbi:prolyl 3-hydroxylase 2-like isoform X2 [Actinia tenebrosa]|uniref:procollagen-proline 3-dioxygenase n=1 Tax=Actinia tenebrosa TaxID=6105 RepID=A0A6P8JBU2_ACTTE|nr:prolyl 3-hydroxylase 2-like isoform X2 [Actinia tenebrosa]
MARRLILPLIFSSFLSFYVNADFLENLTLKETIQYDELYSDGLFAYNLKDFCNASKKFEQALSDYKYQDNVKLHCRDKCYKKFQESLANRNIHTVLEDLELEYFRLTIYSRRCTQKCNEKYLGRRSHVSAQIERDFENRKLYSFLHFSYYKCGQLIKAVQAAFTYLEMWPNDNQMLSNMKYYKTLAIVNDELVFSLEAIPHINTYFKAVKFYEAQDWTNALLTFEQALKEYYQAYKVCKLKCEEKRESNRMLGQEGLTAVYVDILRCRSRCQEKLATINGQVVDNYLPRHYNYLQMCYWKVGKTKEAAECATSYMLLDPDDENMFDNLKIFKHRGNLDGTEVLARKDAIIYHRSINLVSKLLHLAEMYTSDHDIEEEWFEDINDVVAPDDKESTEETEDLVEGEPLDFTSIRVSGLGPIKTPSEMKTLDDLFKEDQFKNVTIIMKDKELNGTNRFLADNFITEKQCGTLNNLVKTGTLGDGYDSRKSKDGSAFSFTDKETFEGVTPISAAKAITTGVADAESVELYLNVSEKARAFVETYFKLETPLYFNYIHLVCREWKQVRLIDVVTGKVSGKIEHISHPVHADNCILHSDGPGTCPKRAPAYTWRDFSAILYLNDNFEGGDFIFAHPNETIQASVKPKCGRLVGFSAGVENLHGVLGVQNGRRCAVALWFTLRTKHDDEGRKKAWKIIRETKEKLVGKDQLKHVFAAQRIDL